MISFADAAQSIDNLMGVKAVWGRSTVPVMCFGSRGDPRVKDSSHFMLARNVAEKAIARPYLVTIGGGEHVIPEHRGRVLELVRVTGVFGETRAFVTDPEIFRRLKQWPVAVVLSEIYQVEGEPLLIEDLGFPDRKILANAYDGVLRDDAQLSHLWDALRERRVSRRWEIQPLPNFRDPGKVQLYGSLYPKVSAREGERIRREMVALERDQKLSRTAKNNNRDRNNGIIVCEGCGFSDQTSALFDAHHLDPLGTGPRWSSVDSFAVLCAICHRWAHYKAEHFLRPLTIDALRAARVAINRE